MTFLAPATIAAMVMAVLAKFRHEQKRPVCPNCGNNRRVGKAPIDGKTHICDIHGELPQ